MSNAKDSMPVFQEARLATRHCPAQAEQRRWIADPRIELTLSVLTPFLAFWPPEHLGGSGVLATVTTGLYSGCIAPQLMGAATRLQGLLFWDFLLYVIEGLVFLITGLQARTLMDRIGGYRLSELIFSALIVSTLVILVDALFGPTPRRIY